MSPIVTHADGDGLREGEPCEGRAPPPLEWRELSETAMKAAWRVVNDEQAAWEASQGTMVVLRLLELADARPKNPAAWVTTVAANRARNELRRRQREQRAKTRLSSRGDQDTADFADRVLARVFFDELLASLPKRQREALELKYRNDLGGTLVADILGIKEGTLKGHLKRGRSAIRDYYQRQGGAE